MKKFELGIFLIVNVALATTSSAMAETLIKVTT
jgi:hypothetical protein